MNKRFFVGLCILTGAYFVCMAGVLVRRYAIETEIPEEPATRYISIATPKPTPTPTPTPTPVPNSHIEFYQTNFKKEFESVPVSAVYMVFESIGDYYITAYCPEECGFRVYSDGSDNYPTGWITATGTICHREEEWWNPSTCGINTSINNYGDLFLIDGKVFVAEDTGPGAVGHWIDTFMPDYESMASFGSHWTEVYSVSYIETDERTWHYDFNEVMKNEIR